MLLGKVHETQQYAKKLLVGRESVVTTPVDGRLKNIIK